MQRNTVCSEALNLNLPWTQPHAFLKSYGLCLSFPYLMMILVPTSYSYVNVEEVTCGTQRIFACKETHSINANHHYLVH